MKTRAPQSNLLYRLAALMTICAALSSTTLAEVPDAPSATKAKQTELAAANTGTSSSASQHQLVASSPKKADGRYSIKTLPFAVAVGFLVAGTVADVETTKAALDRCSGAKEVNSWIYGRRPSRTRLYAINVPVTGFLTWLGARNKRDRKAGDFHAVWPIPFYVVGGVHGIMAAHNAGVRC